MRLHRYALLFVLSFCTLLSAQQAAPQNPSQAVVPRLIRFSGVVRDASGTVGITFSLHKSQDDNAALWIETQSVPLDAAGRYNVLLGATKAEGIPMDLFTSGEAQWLAVQVEGHPEQPRVLLVSVPYALKAAEAETLAGHAASEFVTADKLTTAVQQQLQTQTITTSAVPGNQLVGYAVNSGATNFSGNTTDQVVKVTQTNTTGSGLVVSAPATAIKASSTATTGTPSAVHGFAVAPAGAGVYGTNNAKTGAATGVHGTSASSGGGIGVYGNNIATSGAAVGVKGVSVSTTGTAVVAAETSASGSPVGLLAAVAAPGGVAAVLQHTGDTGKLISGQGGLAHTEVFSVDNAGSVVAANQVKALGSVQDALYGSSNDHNGVYGFSVTQNGVQGISNAKNGFGVSGYNNAGTGVYGGTSAAGGTAVYANAGASSGSNGVLSYGATGVSGFATVDSSVGTYGNAGTSGGSKGVWGVGETGVRGESLVSGAAGRGVFGAGDTGVYGSGMTYGVFGTGNTGVYGTSSNGGNAFYGTSNGGIAFQGVVTGSGGYAIDTFAATGGYAAWFNGDVNVYAGNLTVGGTLSATTKHFKIDHPLDPTNKYLVHASVESSEMKDIYDGTVTTDASGEAVVHLPAWFDALNGNFRYQLTPIGQFAQAIVSKEIENNMFTIKTDKPHVKVSWMVTGVRHDAYARTHPMQVEEEKPAIEKGSYLNPDAFGQPEEKSAAWARRPAAMKRWKEIRATSRPATSSDAAPASASK